MEHKAWLQLKLERVRMKDGRRNERRKISFYLFVFFIPFSFFIFLFPALTAGCSCFAGVPLSRQDGKVTVFITPLISLPLFSSTFCFFGCCYARGIMTWVWDPSCLLRGDVDDIGNGISPRITSLGWSTGGMRYRTVYGF